MSTEGCPFCCPAEERVFHRANKVIGLWDAFPVSPGHALIVPCRHVASWFDATLEEQQELLRAIDVARQVIARTYSPDGFNIGVNIGQSAGQTVFHLHVHVIPRYKGDVTDPTGGIRSVIPGKANYRSGAVAKDSLLGQARHDRTLIRGGDDPMLRDLPTELDGAERADPRRPSAVTAPVEVKTEVPEPPPKPHNIQREALAALMATREAGNSAGLVVLATGLGKTWLSAFDSSGPEFRRVLFVAHRDEILTQSMQTYHRIRPKASLGRYTGTEKLPDADVLFASIQTLGRQEHLDLFSRDSFDYITVDEFHHAAANTYRRLIGHFAPKFLLGLTATPERMDGGDLLALCQENLVFRCDVMAGIRQGLLCQFQYFGVADEVNYANIPWRNSRFDDEMLTRAVATHSRAQNALEQYRQRAGKRTLGFCCSQRHADFMADFFNQAGLRAAAVHAGHTSAPRTASLERLAAGDLDIIFAVDMFNEGIDIPAIDTVMMLRPTESSIIWLQQFGRGLRQSSGKPHLTVIDYIGNHRTFLVKPRTLFQLDPGDGQISAALKRLSVGEVDLPPGCGVTYELAAVDILKALLRAPRADEALRNYYVDFRERRDTRPTAAEVFHDGYNPRTVRRTYGSWLRFVKAMGDFSAREQAVLDTAGEFFNDLEITPMTKSFKMLTLQAMLNTDTLPGSLTIDALTQEFGRIASRSAALKTDVGTALEDQGQLRRLIETNPIEAWAYGGRSNADCFFAYKDGVFQSRFNIESGCREVFRDMVREVVDWRLAEYLQRLTKTEWQEAVRGMINAPDLDRELAATEGTVRHEVDQGRLTPDRRRQSGEREDLYFSRERIPEIRRLLDLPDVTDETIKKLFFDFVEEMDMSASYKPVLMLSFLEAADPGGWAPVGDVVKRFRGFYEKRARDGLRVEQPKARMSRVADLTDAEVQNVVVTMPLRRFQQYRYFDYGHDVARMQFNPSLWRQLSESDIERVRAICRASIERYYLRLG